MILKRPSSDGLFYEIKYCASIIEKQTLLCYNKKSPYVIYCL